MEAKKNQEKKEELSKKSIVKEVDYLEGDKIVI